MAKTNSVRRLDKPRRPSYGRYPQYTPSAEEIAAGCLEFQTNWDEREYRRRAGVEPVEAIHMMVVRIPQAAAARLNLGTI